MEIWANYCNFPKWHQYSNFNDRELICFAKQNFDSLKRNNNKNSIWNFEFLLDKKALESGFRGFWSLMGYGLTQIIRC